jgi:molecular chaperone DnaK (HSP70)
LHNAEPSLDFSDFEYRYIVGIDLGTTNTALAFVDRTQPDPECRKIRFFNIPQLVAPGSMGKSPVLPSFLYLPGPYELPPESTSLPWDSGRSYIVGELGREQGALVPGRLVSSAKSWLCHGGVDRTADILPWGAGSDVGKISPVEASSRVLRHLREAWNTEMARGREGFRLEEQIVLLTVPASFDEVARELTVTAARDAGLSRIILVEEPLAAFYAWLSRHEENWREGMRAGQPCREQDAVCYHPRGVDCCPEGVLQHPYHPDDDPGTRNEPVRQGRGTPRDSGKCLGIIPGIVLH